MILTPSSLEPLESRIAPAAIPIINPLPDITAGVGKTGATVELSEMFDPTVAHPNHTIVTFTVNLDSDPLTPGNQPSTFVMELFDDEAPLTVQSFLSYLQNPDTARDFTGTFFHRSIPGFIVQGGGFDASNLSKHLPVGPEVHNEFDVSRSNLTGTVAMAKTGLGPNTATSEWFVNVADNSANLDAQNGGFTVFGQIISGLDVFTKINALPTTNQGGALTNVPVQNNYNSDPDHNPFTPPPAPTGNQLIKIIGVQVAKPAGVIPSTYKLSATSSDPDLVTATVDPVTHKLKLKYAAGKSGEADITVHAVDGADSGDDVFHVKVLPNLIADITTDPLPNIIVPGDIGTAVVKLTNNGSGNYTSTDPTKVSTKVDVKFYLSKVTDTEPTGTVVDPTDILVGTVTGKAINLAGGASTTVSVPLTIPEQLVTVEGQAYHLIAQVTASDAATTTTELFTDDNTAVDGKVHALVNQVGTVTVSGAGTRLIPKLTFADHDGDRVVVRLTGAGNVKVIPDAAADGNEFSLSVTGTNLLSSLAVAAKPPADPANTTHNGRVELRNTDIANPIGTVNLAGADVDGYTTISSGAQILQFGKLSGDHTLLVGALLPANNTPLTVVLGQVTDYNLESDQPIGTLKAVNWHDTLGDDDHIIAPSINALSITGNAAVTPKVNGDFQANVTLEGKAKMSLFRVAGFFENATFTAIKTKSVDAVTVGGMQHAGFFLGTEARPTDIGDFTKVRSIGTFTVTGAASTGDVFIDAQVAAANIGAISLVDVDTTNGGVAFGFVADKIASYVRKGSTPLTNLNKAGSPYDKHDDYSVTVV